MNPTFEALKLYFAIPADAFFGLGVLIVVWVYLTAADFLATALPDTYTDFWFHRAQLLLKAVVHLGVLGVIILFGFLPPPMNFIFMLVLALFAVALVYWLRSREGILTIKVVGTLPAKTMKVKIVKVGDGDKEYHLNFHKATASIRILPGKYVVSVEPIPGSMLALSNTDIVLDAGEKESLDLTVS